MKKSLKLILTFALLISLMPMAKAMQTDYSQFEGLPYDPPIVTLKSPLQNATYNVPDVPLNVTVEIRGWILKNIERIRCLSYSLDGDTSIPLTLIVPDTLKSPYQVYGNSMLTGLSNGSHNLTIFGETFIGGLNCYFNETVFFTIDTSYKPIDTSIPLPLNTFIIIIAVLALIIVTLSVLAFRRHRKTSLVKKV
jgi:hypothetical protein